MAPSETFAPTVIRGRAPLILSMPHGGRFIPHDCKQGLVDAEAALRDADHWIDQVYGFAAEKGVTIVRAKISRTVIDVNRDPTGASLYPGMKTTGLVPQTGFDEAPLYHDGKLPAHEEISRRINDFHVPYHEALTAEIARLRGTFANVVLYDCHSIISTCPMLFDGELPVLNLGTNDGTSCAPELEQRLANRCSASGLSFAHNGRFKGGWITRAYGDPQNGVHAVQMELAQRAYMAEPLGRYDAERAAPLTAVLEALIADIETWLEDVNR